MAALVASLMPASLRLPTRLVSMSWVAVMTLYSSRILDCRAKRKREQIAPITEICRIGGSPRFFSLWFTTTVYMRKSSQVEANMRRRGSYFAMNFTSQVYYLDMRSSTSVPRRFFSLPYSRSRSPFGPQMYQQYSMESPGILRPEMSRPLPSLAPSG